MFLRINIPFIKLKRDHISFAGRAEEKFHFFYAVLHKSHAISITLYLSSVKRHLAMDHNHISQQTSNFRAVAQCYQHYWVISGALVALQEIAENFSVPKNNLKSFEIYQNNW